MRVNYGSFTMRKILLATAAVALMAGPALAQSNITVVTPPPPPSNIVVTPPQTAVEPPAPAYESKTIEHSDNGFSQTTRKSEQQLNPDGSSSTMTQTVHHEGD
jgi:hypothetical protein